MIKSITALSTLLCFTTLSWGKPLSEVEWVDLNLKNCVEKTAEKNNWQNSEEFTELKCHKMKIKSAQELNDFTSLEGLSLFSNQLTVLDLTALSNLTSLNIANNKLSDLKITGLGKLQTLYLFRNKLEEVDLTGLSGLKKVRLMQNALTRLDITPLISLEEGHFFDNQLEDLQITGLEKLTFLDVKQNPMPDELYDFYDEQDGIVISHDGNADDWQ